MHTDTITAPPALPPHPAALRIGLAPAGPDCTFGRFALHAPRKLLVCLPEGRQVVLGGRAFDLLLALVARAGEVVGHDELVSAVWPCSIVEDNGLRVHMSALRKALGDGPADPYILTVPGRGYRLVKPVYACPDATTQSAARSAARPARGLLPPAPVYVFDDFQLLRAPAQLLRGATPVHVGRRAFALLLALVERAGEVVSHAELDRLVWPGSIVDDSCLRVHVGALRRALGDCAVAPRYVANIPGRGYSFVARLERLERPTPTRA